MKVKFLLPLPVLLLIFSATFAQNKSVRAKNNLGQRTSAKANLPKGIDANWYSEAISKIDASQYTFKHSANTTAFAAINSANAMLFDITPTGYTAKSLAVKQNMPAWQTSFALLNIGRDNNFLCPKKVNAVINNESLRYVNNNFDIQYVNDNKGLRQNFIIKKRQPGNSELAVNIGLGNEMTYQLKNKNQLLCFDNADKSGSVKLIYEDLKVWDANGNTLTAYMKLDNKVLSLMVNDKNAVYPITIDPLNKTPEWTTSANGVLPGILTNLQTQVDALYGFNVAALGDVNGDGFDDIAVGAPGAIDIVAGTAVVSAGAVFVFFGSATGPSTTPSKVLRANTVQVNALFGFSIAGGNVTGNSRNDIIVGAPGDSYSILLNGFPTNVTAGKVYIFSGDSLTTANPVATISLSAAGTPGTSFSVNPLFGFSVAAAEDMSGDGLGEVVVGSPGYAEVGLPARSGAAFVYDTARFRTNTPIKLLAPTAAQLGTLNNDGLLFGFSVDGVGDYNQDGKPDVVVGAPAGIILAPGALLGGSAYVYNGTGLATIINPVNGTQLKAKANLTDTLANLFGYFVRGVRNPLGARDGSIIAGAPTDSILSNVTNGLRLKAGSINVFVRRAAPGTVQLPNQRVSSPRGNALTTILTGQQFKVAALFGASIDNMLDVNCDGINDIIVGEPLSSAVGVLFSGDVVGGAAYIFTGRADGTYNPTPFWNVENQTSLSEGVNAASLLGYSVAGARYVRGPLNAARALVGAPGGAFDFSTGIFNLNNTLDTLLSFADSSNGLGKAYLFGFPTCSILPISLLSFTGAKDENKVQLKWQTSAEQNSNYFDVEYSTNGNQWKSIGKIKAAGNSTKTQHYSLLHNSPAEGVNLYRLKQVDTDGKFVYSNVLPINFKIKGINISSIYPNPFVDKITIEVSGDKTETIRIQLSDNFGRVLKVINTNIQKGVNLIPLESLSGLSSGMYVISVNTSSATYNLKIKK